MPNHIITEVEISGTKEQIADLIKKTKITLDNDTQDNKFDFNGIIKMPKKLRETTSPTKIVATQEEADEKNQEEQDRADKNGYERNTKSFISEKEAENRRNKYQAINWYDFACANWGTKWNAYDVRYLLGDEEKIVISITTAWDTPQGIWRHLENEGFKVRGVMYGEMDGYEFIGGGDEVFDAYQDVETEYIG